jgi:hypothetical protein
VLDGHGGSRGVLINCGRFAGAEIRGRITGPGRGHSRDRSIGRPTRRKFYRTKMSHVGRTSIGEGPTRHDRLYRRSEETIARGEGRKVRPSFCCTKTGLFCVKKKKTGLFFSIFSRDRRE